MLIRTGPTNEWLDAQKLHGRQIVVAVPSELYRRLVRTTWEWERELQGSPWTDEEPGSEVRLEFDDVRLVPWDPE